MRRDRIFRITTVIWVLAEMSINEEEKSGGTNCTQWDREYVKQDVIHI